MYQNHLKPSKTEPYNLETGLSAFFFCTIQLIFTCKIWQEIKMQLNTDLQAFFGHYVNIKKLSKLPIKK